MTNHQDANSKHYYFIDIDLYSRQIVGWDTETKDHVEVNLTNGCYRVFLTKGQYNKLVKKLEEARA
ncbi:MAG: hypothetical protein HQ582_23730 [Planctomycetes bacterium]|nr:hypothetical protein [Planctomycetota bacterium]